MADFNANGRFYNANCSARNIRAGFRADCAKYGHNAKIALKYCRWQCEKTVNIQIGGSYDKKEEKVHCLAEHPACAAHVDERAAYGLRRRRRCRPCRSAGPQGEQGPAGPAGPQGPQGPQGPSGAEDTGDEYVPSEAIKENEYIFPGENGNFGFKGKFYVDYSDKDEATEAAHALAVQVAGEGDVLLKNENNALPLADGANVTLLGIRSAYMIRSGFGSGSGGGSSAGTMLGDSLREAGFNVNPKTESMYLTKVGQMVEDQIAEIGMENYGSSITSTYNAYGDAAIVTFSRTGAENFDIATNNAVGCADEDMHGLQLNDNETALIKHAKQHFDKVIVVINSSNIMQIPELAEPKTDGNLGVDAILWVGSVGQDGTTALAHILNGDITPSGHTSDLWEKDFKQSPTWTNFGTNSQNKDEDGNRMDVMYYQPDGSNTNFATVEYREGIYYGFC